MFTSGWAIRPYRPGDEQAICHLHDQIFRFPMSIEHWKWYFQDNPAGHAKIVVVETSDQQIIAHYAAVPNRAQIGDDEGILLQGADSMVHPDYRRQGITTAIALEFAASVEREQKGALVFAFTNERSGPLHAKRAHWKAISGILPIWIRPLDFPALTGHILRNRLLARLSAPCARIGYHLLRPSSRIARSLYRITPITQFDERFDQLWERARDIAQVVVKRNQAYLNWRYASPTRSYTILCGEDHEGHLLGYLVLSVREMFGMRMAFIVDILTDSAAATLAQHLIHEAVQEATRQQCALVNSMMLTHIPYVAALKRSGFIRLPAQMFPQDLYLSGRRTDNRFAEELLLNVAHWYVTWGDHDSL